MKKFQIIRGEHTFAAVWDKGRKVKDARTVTSKSENPADTTFTVEDADAEPFLREPDRYVEIK